MTEHKNKGRALRHSPSGEQADYTAENDPVIGWFNLAKPSRARQQERGWKRKGARK
jgi:hypothetical protein